MRCRTRIASAIVVLGVAVGAQAAWASNGNALAAKRCQKNGWQALQTSSGGSFTNQSECVSYAASGGSLFAPTLTITETTACVQSTTGNFVYEWSEQGTGFTPNSSLTITTGGDSLPWPTPFDSTGAKTLHFIPDSAGETLSVTWADGNGVHASATLGPTEACSP
jgi:hypothetical protein